MIAPSSPMGLVSLGYVLIRLIPAACSVSALMLIDLLYNNTCGLVWAHAFIYLIEIVRQHTTYFNW